MNRTHRTLRSRLRARRAGLAGAAAALVALAAAIPATAAPATFGSGTMDWGVKESFRTYITGPIAEGSYTASKGATKLGEPAGLVRFDVLGGTYETDTRVGELAIDGTVRFTGHGGELDITMRNLCVQLSGTAGTIYADLDSKNRQTGVMEYYRGVALADLPSVPAPVDTGTGLSWNSIGARLAAGGAPAFGLYPAGTAIDPIAPLSAVTGPPRPRPDGGPCRSPSGGGGGGTGGGGGIGGGDTGGDQGGSQAKAPVIRAVKRAVTVRRNGVARIATLRCRTGPCTVRTRKKVRVKIKGKRYAVRVLAPKRVRAGKVAQVRVRLPKAARRALAGRRAKVKLRVVATARGERTAQTVRATIKAKRKAAKRTGARANG